MPPVQHTSWNFADGFPHFPLERSSHIAMWRFPVLTKDDGLGWDFGVELCRMPSLESFEEDTVVVTIVRIIILWLSDVERACTKGSISVSAAAFLLWPDVATGRLKSSNSHLDSAFWFLTMVNSIVPCTALSTLSSSIIRPFFPL